MVKPNIDPTLIAKDPSATPAMRQWAEQKTQASDAILLFRMGDFYETFYDDAHTVSRALGLTLTSRSKDTPIPLAGIPYHALDNYLSKLVQAGFKVAISEQTEDPKLAKGVVKRAIVRVVTPGTLTDDHLLDESASNYLVAVCTTGGAPEAACLDLAAGEFFTVGAGDERLIDELARLSPAEVLVSEEPSTGDAELAAQLRELSGARVAHRPPHTFDRFHATQLLHQQFGVETLSGFGYDDDTPGLCAAGAILAYVNETQCGAVEHIVGIRHRVAADHVRIDPNSWRSLEIERTIRSGTTDGTLYAALNRTSCALGARHLRGALRFPLCSRTAIVARQEGVAELFDDRECLERLRDHLRGVCDVERVTARLGLRRCSPRDLRALGQTLQSTEVIRTELRDAAAGILRRLADAGQNTAILAERLLTALADDAPLTVREGRIFADGVDDELDRLRTIGRDGKSWLARYQAEQSERTGIPSLKVGFNRVFGYYLEITNAHRDAAPADYVRKQTLKGAERYITDELKAFETEALDAQDRAAELEYRLFNELMDEAAEYIPQLLETARAIGLVDMMCSFACIAAERNYQRPQFVDDPLLELVDGRHPVLDHVLGSELVPNDTVLNTSDARLLLITGPNMAGKSTYIRQVALLTLMAHTGSFVPASSMRIGAVDRIFARVGASDEISRGQSTFMVEMVEAANILNNATAHSLVILDELGRGTSTYDGLSLAWAVCEHIVRRITCRTLFATHYHELTELARLLEGVHNYNVAVREWPAEQGRDARIVFLHKIVAGSADKSYGVHVAQIAGIPRSVVKRAGQVLRHLESGLSRSSLRDVLSGQHTTPTDQLELFAAQDDRLRQALLDLDVDHLTPMDALVKIKELQDEAR